MFTRTGLPSGFYAFGDPQVCKVETTPQFPDNGASPRAKGNSVPNDYPLPLGRRSGAGEVHETGVDKACIFASISSVPDPDTVPTWAIYVFDATSASNGRRGGRFPR